MGPESAAGSAVAIVGIGARLPGARDLDDLFRLLVEGRTAARRFTRDELVSDGVPERLASDPDFVPVRAVVDDGAEDAEAAKDFDASFFGMSPGEASLVDPQHRLFLECCHRALEDAALDPARFEGPIGVYGGCSTPTYLLNTLNGHHEVPGALAGMALVLGNDKDHLATRVAWKLGLGGPALSVGTACSTSLVAVHLACQALLDLQCDAALAGAASVVVPIRSGHLWRKGHIWSRDGACRAFDREADGVFSGDGAAVFCLRRLEDALRDGDPIRAVLLASAINNDGSRKVGYSAPSVDAQAEVVAEALALAGVEAGSIGLVEAHGTGTALGDPVEVAALAKAFRRATRGSARTALTSIKANLGHLNAAAGAAGLVRAVLSLERETIPPQRDFSAPLPDLSLESSPFYVPTAAVPWPRGPEPRRAGVTALGAGGTNAHVVLEEAPLSPAPPDDGSLRLLLVSARSEAALDETAADLAAALERGPEPSVPTLRDVAWTLHAARRHHPIRRAVVARSREEAAAALRAGGAAAFAPSDRERPVVFAFPGQGVQRPGMARALYAADPVFRETADRLSTLFAALLGRDPRDSLLAEPPSDAGDEPDHDHEHEHGHDVDHDDQLTAGPALFVAGVSLARALSARGVRPAAVLGHSTGEYAAAAVAGILSDEDAARLFAERARLLATLPPGAAVLVFADPDRVSPLLPEDAWVSLVNGPAATVVSATPEAAAVLERALPGAGISSRRLRVSVAPHCPLLAPVAADLRAAARSLTLRLPAIPFSSGLGGGFLAAAEATDPEHWVRHLTEPIRFDRAVLALGDLDPVVLEAGPPRSAGSLVRASLPLVPVVEGLPEPAAGALELAGRLWVHGAAVDAEPLFAGGPRRRVHLPPTAFERRRCWVEAAPSADPAPPREAPAQAPPSYRAGAPRPSLPVPFVAPRTPTERALAEVAARLLGLREVGVDDDFLALGADSLMVLRLLDEARRVLDRGLPDTAAFAGLTVADLARHAGDGAAPGPGDRRIPAAPSLVAVQPRGHRPPFFCVHPAAGPVFPYFELARRLGADQPFWALQAHGLDGRTEPHRTVEEMARAYVDAVREVDPRGPYHLGGYSFGALVAYEMARLLARDGAAVPLLAILDEPAPTAGHRPGMRMIASLFAGSFVKSFLPHLRDYLYLTSNGRGAAASERPAAARGGLARLRRLLEESAMATIVPPDSRLHALRQPAMTPMARLFAIHVFETFRYSPGPYDGPLVLFRSGAYDRWDPHPNLGWDKLVRGPIEVVPVPGDHLSTIRAPHVEVLARELRRRLDLLDGAPVARPAGGTSSP